MVDALDAQTPIQKCDVNWETHTECVNRLSGENPKRFSGFEVVVTEKTDSARARSVRNLCPRRQRRTACTIVYDEWSRPIH